MSTTEERLANVERAVRFLLGDRHWTEQGATLLATIPDAPTEQASGITVVADPSAFVEAVRTALHSSATADEFAARVGVIFAETDAPAPEPEAGKWWVVTRYSEFHWNGGAGYTEASARRVASEWDRDFGGEDGTGPHHAIFADSERAARAEYARRVAEDEMRKATEDPSEPWPEVAQGEEDAAEDDELLYAVASLIGWAETRRHGHTHRVEARDTIARLVWTDPDYKPLSLDLARALFAHVASKQGADLTRLTRERDDAQRLADALQASGESALRRAEFAEATVAELRGLCADARTMLTALDARIGANWGEMGPPPKLAELYARLAAAARGEAV